MNKCFIKISRAEGEAGKGGYWMIDEAHAQAELGLEPRGGTSAGHGAIQSRTPPKFSSSSKARKHSRSQRKKKKSAAIVASFVDAKKKTFSPTTPSPSSSSSSSSSVVPRLFGIGPDDPESTTLLSLDDVPEIMLDSDSEAQECDEFPAHLVAGMLGLASTPGSLIGDHPNDDGVLIEGTDAVDHMEATNDAIGNSFSALGLGSIAGSLTSSFGRLMSTTGSLAGSFSGMFGGGFLGGGPADLTVVGHHLQLHAPEVGSDPESRTEPSVTPIIEGIEAFSDAQ